MTEPSRAERLFEAHKRRVVLRWSEGLKWFRQRRTLTKTMRTHLAQLRQDGHVVLSKADQDALDRAGAVLARLSGDFELAERLAKRFVKAQEAQNAQSEQQRRQALADQWLGHSPTTAELMLWVSDITTLVAMIWSGRGEEPELERILGTDAPAMRSVHLTRGIQQLDIAITGGHDWPMALNQAKLAVIEWLAENVAGVDPYAASNGIERRTWQAWREHRQRMRALLATPVHDPDADHAD